MTFFASVAGIQVVGGSLLVPMVGAWSADLYLATDQAVSGAVPVTIGNLTLIGFVYRSDAYGGQTRARLVGGYGGWRTQVSNQGYGSNSGVKLSHVLQDVASACGEHMGPVGDATVGPAFTRLGLGGVASDVLWNLVGAGVIPAWRVDTAGVTQVTAWPASTVSTPFQVTDQRPDEGMVVIATEDYASWLPGASFTAPQLLGSFTVAGVHYHFDNDGTFRLEVLTGTSDRLLGALQAIIARQVAPTRFYGRYEYTISNPTETTIDCSPVDGSLGLPDFQGIPITADSATEILPPAGGTAHVMFIDGKPSRPQCVWTSNPTVAQILGGTMPVARLGDTVQSMLTLTPPNLTGAISFGVSGPMLQGVPYPINPAASFITGLVPVSGTIVTGSETVATQ